ncbi:FAD-dependent oxidoreductase [Faecalicatena sp. AGMB00832]|uniref:FAD-dependent oxidoreductase n=2 Tax=Faecalicatena faecalis TaxID=2726362 RepID=A0ABS6CY20_9FIRM|nr:FAD-dependent oxidoreductase [Faecalicatena faecalis]
MQEIRVGKRGWKMYRQEYDVIVAGGGTAGIAAGLSAARAGAHVLLIEKNSYVGGTAASGLPFIDFFNRDGKQITAGIAEELMKRLFQEKAALGHIRTSGGHLNSVTMIDPEWVKITAEEMLLESGCELLYHSFVCGAKVEEDCLKSIVVANKNGLTEFRAGCFIDTTGDGDLAKFSGARYHLGRESDGLCQAMSLLFKLGDVDVERATSLFSENPIPACPVGGDHEYNLHISGKLSKWNDIILKEGIFEHPDHNIWAGTMRENELTYVNTIRVSEKNGADAYELSEAEIEGRRQLKKVIRFLNAYVPGMEKAHITSIPNGIGIRETRRIDGEYILTGEDIIEGRRFDDCIARNGYCIDIHDPKGQGWGVSRIQSEEQSYDIPYRCIVPARIDNLLVAGRCISTTAEALASTRIMPSCMALGQAAGVAASMAADRKLAPRKLDVKSIQTILRGNGALI